MGLSLIGYFCSMAATFAVVMALLNSFLDYSATRSIHHHPHARPPIAQAAMPEQTTEQAGPSIAAVSTAALASKVTDDAAVRKAGRSAAEKSKAIRQALNTKPKTPVPQPGAYSTALGYAQEPSDDGQNAPLASPHW